MRQHPSPTTSDDASLARGAIVLVVDHEGRTARRLAAMLREDGFVAEVATDGAGAIARLSQEPLPDAIITDTRLSHADGAAVVRYARSRRPSMRVIVTTEQAQHASSLVELWPTVHVLVKPVVYDELVARLGEAPDAPPASGGRTCTCTAPPGEALCSPGAPSCSPRPDPSR